MEPKDSTPKVINGYDPKSGIRTALGVLASMLIMGLPVGATEIIRPGGDRHVAMLGFIATVLAVVLGYLSIHGTKE